MKNLINRPPIFFLGIYILVIFVFAFLYQVIPQGFYHSNIKHENSYKEGIKKIKNDLIDVFRKSIAKSILSKNCRIEKSNLSPIDFEFHQNSPIARFSFQVSVGFSDKKYIGVKFYKIQLEMQVDSSINTEFNKFIREVPIKFNSEIIHEFKINNPIPSLIKSEICNFKSEKFFIFSKMFNSYTIEVDQKIENEIYRFYNASQGFPFDIPDTFLRMLYFSAITITSVGFGDITPLTTYSRLLVGVEAILGNLIFGIFLWSLTERLASNRKN